MVFHESTDTGSALRKLLPELDDDDDDDLRHFPNKEIGRSEILDIACARIRSLKASTKKC